ncbi:hypothetical protein B0I35DRAFT_221850 [Stachybotrys elegans]|uniref:Uncharacterized protein n=1 Tax=Stachybotrys elegans TaxID=80388 RepID=A0A8K0WSH2_9HYPO|nr:hypothetical protein B0I35DRAFT_221850 [Stachybotrys elegans]
MALVGQASDAECRSKRFYYCSESNRAAALSCRKLSDVSIRTGCSPQWKYICARPALPASPQIGLNDVLCTKNRIKNRQDLRLHVVVAKLCRCPAYTSTCNATCRTIMRCLPLEVTPIASGGGTLMKDSIPSANSGVPSWTPRTDVPCTLCLARTGRAREKRHKPFPSPTCIYRADPSPAGNPLPRHSRHTRADTNAAVSCVLVDGNRLMEANSRFLCSGTRRR